MQFVLGSCWAALGGFSRPKTAYW